MIHKCICNHKYQDKTYGAGRRVFNPGKAPQGAPRWVCSVCGREKASRGAVPKKERPVKGGKDRGAK